MLAAPPLFYQNKNMETEQKVTKKESCPHCDEKYCLWKRIREQAIEEIKITKRPALKQKKKIKTKKRKCDQEKIEYLKEMSKLRKRMDEEYRKDSQLLERLRKRIMDELG